MTGGAGAPIRQFELVIGNGRSSNPYVWRIRYALAARAGHQAGFVAFM